MNYRKILKVVLWSIPIVPLSALILLIVNFHMISLISGSCLVEDADDLQEFEYTLVPGAGHYKPDYWTNYTFNYRIEAAALLYNKAKTRKIIVSGVYTNPEFDEVGDMQKVLLTFGVAAEDVIPDYEGYRTWNSVYNIRKKTDIQKVLITSQPHHLERAVFIAKCIGLDATGFPAEKVPRTHRYWIAREYLARAKASCDCLKYKLGIGNEYTK
jgi:SanA protein